MKRVLGILLAAVLVLWTTAVFTAAGSDGTVTITFTVTANAGAMTAKVKFTYDTSVLEFAAANGMNGWTAPQNGNGSFGIANADSVIPLGDIGTATFRIRPGTAPGQYPVNAVVERSIDTNYQTVSMSVSGGVATVNSSTASDDTYPQQYNGGDQDTYYYNDPYVYSSPSASGGEIRISYADASSWVVGKDPSSYIPAKMIDGDETTSFQISVKTTPLGSAYVYFYLESPSTVRSLWIKNGFWKITNGLDQYTRNCRVKTMTVDFMSSGSSYYTDAVSVSLPDDQSRSDWSKVDLGTHTNVMAVRFTIQDVYRGSKFRNDVCISEVRFMGDATGTGNSWNSTVPNNSTVSSGGIYGLALQKLATRSGPGTQYYEKGTYFVAGQYIKILSRAWDSRNSIWWVKCEIPYKGEIRVLWTGYKRFDSNTVPLESIPVEYY